MVAYNRRFRTRLGLGLLEDRLAPAVLFSDGLGRANVVNNVYGLGALDNFAGTTAPHNHAHFYDPNFPTNNDAGFPVGADLVAGALQGRGLDYGGVQFTTVSSTNAGENIGQDLNIRADLFVPRLATGQA